MEQACNVRLLTSDCSPGFGLELSSCPAAVRAVRMIGLTSATAWRQVSRCWWKEWVVLIRGGRFLWEELTEVTKDGVTMILAIYIISKWAPPCIAHKAARNCWWRTSPMPLEPSSTPPTFGSYAKIPPGDYTMSTIVVAINNLSALPSAMLYTVALSSAMILNVQCLPCLCTVALVAAGWWAKDTMRTGQEVAWYWSFVFLLLVDDCYDNTQ